MERQHAHSRSLKSIAGAAIVWLGIFVLVGNLGRAVPQLSNLLCRAAGEGLGILPSAVVEAWGAIRDYAFDHPRLSECLFQLLSFLPLLLVMGGTI